MGSWRGGAARWVVALSAKSAAVGSAFWPRRAIQPVPGLFVGPTGNSVAPGDSRARVGAHVALGRFDAPSRRWQQHTNRSRDPRSKQIASCLLHSVYRPRKDHSRTGLDIGCDPGRVLQSDHVRTLLMKPPPPAITASTSWLTALRA